MSNPTVIPVVDEGLGNSTYLLDLGDGRASGAWTRAGTCGRSAPPPHGGDCGSRSRSDTHLHADFLSGRRQLAATDGAQLLASAAGGREFPHTGLRDERRGRSGRAAAAGAGDSRAHPRASGVPAARRAQRGRGVHRRIAAGRVGGPHRSRVARTGPRNWPGPSTRSLRRLPSLRDEVSVWPTHGAGRSAPPRPARRGPARIGTEKATNPLLGAPTRTPSWRALLGSLGSFPPYFLRLGEINRRGPGSLARHAGTWPELTVDAGACAAGRRRGQIVDVRPVTGFAAGHLRGAMSIPLRPAFATWLGWLAATGPAAGRSSGTTTRTRTRSSGRRRRSATTTSSASSPAEWRLARRRRTRHDQLPLVPAEHIDGRRCWTSGRPRSSLAGHCPGCGARRTRRHRRPRRGSTAGAAGGDVRARGTGDERRQPARRAPGTTTSPCWTAGPIDWVAATGRRAARRVMTETTPGAGRSGWACGPTPPSSPCWSRSTPWSAAWSARNAPSCPCWPSRSSTSPPTPPA